MKTRNGFVSNSSSSSFVCAVTKMDHEAILAEMEDNLAEVMRKYVEDGKIGDLEIVAFGNMSDIGGECSFSGRVGRGYDEDEGDNLYNAESMYRKILKEKGINAFTMGFDM